MTTGAGVSRATGLIIGSWTGVGTTIAGEGRVIGGGSVARPRREAILAYAFRMGEPKVAGLRSSEEVFCNK